MKLVICGCDHEYQDKKLRKNVRFANETNNGARCTSCGTEKSRTLNRSRF